MAKNNKHPKGFTVIELLIVIAIIGLLASIVLVSVTAARNKAKDARIKSDVAQFKTLLALEYNDTESYLGLQPNNAWINRDATCDNIAFSSTNYTVKARILCNDIYNNTAKKSGDAILYFGVQAKASPFVPKENYSIMVYLNSGKMYCTGSSGLTSEYEGYDMSKPGCWSNP